MENRTQFTKHRRYYTNVGEPDYYNYHLHINEKGKEELIADEKVDLYGSIQASADSVDIHTILYRYQMGDITALNGSAEEQFFDATEAPKTLADMYRMNQEAENYFNSLSVDQRAAFNFDIGEFLAAYGSEKFINVLNVKEESEVIGDAES